MFGTVFLSLLLESGFHDKVPQAKLTFVKSDYILRAYVLPLRCYNQDRCCVMVPYI